jgi:hypothetical protein
MACRYVGGGGRRKATLLESNREAGDVESRLHELQGGGVGGL